MFRPLKPSEDVIIRYKPTTGQCDTAVAEVNEPELRQRCQTVSNSYDGRR